jgi:PTH1 family peptidyl-tRNA hydrolase
MVRGAFAKLLRRDDRSGPASTPTIILGIGNPGRGYELTRHNVGFWCIDRLAEKHSIQGTKKHRLADTTEGSIDSQRVVLVKPKTFVNNSGQAVTSMFTRYRAKVESLIVVYDDMALPSGKLRIRARGSHGGHNGMRSIIGAVGTQEFVRLRIGVGRPEGRLGDIDHVLSKPTAEERKSIDEGIDRAIDAIGMTLTEGVDRAMNVYN